MEKLLELEDIALYPAELNNGYQLGKYNYGVLDDLDKITSLPIFTSPSDSVVDKNNWRIWSKEGIRPVLPRTENIDIRLDGCQYIFTAFSLPEVKEHFISRGKRNSSNQFRVCIDCGNGADIEIFNISQQLKKIYGPQINLMAGNIGNAKTYIDYCKAGIDYVRVGISSGSLVDYSRYGFYYPIAQLLIDIIGIRNTSCIGLRQTKIIADGGVNSIVDILKCIALGADYVMCGRQFVRLIEAAGDIGRKDEKSDTYNMISREEAVNLLSELGPKEAKLKRLYCGNTTYEEQAKRDGYSNVDDWMDGGCKTKPSDSRTEWVSVTSTLKAWISDMYDKFNYAFAMSNAVDWKTYKQNIKYGRIQ